MCMFAVSGVPVQSVGNISIFWKFNSRRQCTTRLLLLLLCHQVVNQANNHACMKFHFRPWQQRQQQHRHRYRQHQQHRTTGARIMHNDFAHCETDARTAAAAATAVAASGTDKYAHGHLALWVRVWVWLVAVALADADSGFTLCANAEIPGTHAGCDMFSAGQAWRVRTAQRVGL